MMHIQLKGTTFFFASRFERFPTKKSLIEALTTQGARYSESWSAVDVYVQGTNDSNYTNPQPSLLDIPVIDEAQLLMLLKHGELDIDFVPAREHYGALSIDELLGETRSVLAQPPGFEAWQTLTRLLDACKPEHRHMLLEYVRPQLAQWPTRDRNLCMAPNHWIHQALQNEDAQFLDLATWIDLSNKDLTCTKVCKLIKHPQTANIRRLDLPSRVHLNKSLAKILGSPLWLQSLSCLGIAAVKVGATAGLGDSNGLPALRTVNFLSGEVVTRDERQERFKMLCHPTFERVTHIINSGEPRMTLRWDKGLPIALPACEHFEVNDAAYEYFVPSRMYALNRNTRTYLEELDEFIVSGLTTLTLNVSLGRRVSEPTHVDLRRYTQVETLRVYMPRIELGDPGIEPFIEGLLSTQEHVYPEGLKRFVTNLPLTSPTLCTLAQNLPHVEFVHEAFDVDY